jgi:dolichol-phosphate mannosyltransferase
VYNEELVIGHLRAALEAFLPAILCPIEIILINDGSRDATLDHLIAWSQSDSRVRVIHLSRNFGHQIAVTAGLDYAAGEVIVILDADLQDPLAVVPKMIERYMEGYDVVYGQRATRAGESSMKKFSAWLFYRIMQTFVDPRLPADTGDFRLVSRTCLDALKLMRETHRFLRGMIAWVGYPQIAVTYDRQPRVAGTTKYPLRKMLAFSWTASTSFSTVPIRIAGLVGILVGAIGLEEVGRTLFFRFMGWYTVPGWASLMVAICLIGSAILIGIAIVGEYLGKVYEQAKDRPLYLVARTFGYSADGQ